MHNERKKIISNYKSLFMFVIRQQKPLPSLLDNVNAKLKKIKEYGDCRTYKLVSSGRKYLLFSSIILLASNR